MLLILVSMLYGQNRSGDNKSVSLDSVVVVGNTHGTNLRKSQDGTMYWNLRMMNDLPKILGNADPLHYSQMLPGISTNGEYDAGLHVMGCDNGHNRISIDGTPLYGASHILGLFSIFNAAHFQQMVIKKIPDASFADYLGAELTMQTHYEPTDSLTGEVAVGLISSQGTFRIPVTKNSELAVSLRKCYLNLLYGSLLRDKDAKLKYSFYDANVTYNHRINENNRLLFNFYMGNDDANMTEERMMSDMNVKWDNLMTSLRWEHDKGEVEMSNNFYYTQNKANGSLDMMSLAVELPSSISEFGNRFAVSWGDWKSGADLSLYRIQPQIPNIKSTFYNVKLDIEKTNSFQGMIYVDRNWKINKSFKAVTGLRGSWYHTGTKNYWHISPSTSIAYTPNKNFDISLSYSLRHQYLVQTGISSINTPLEFWLSAGTYGVEPQVGHNVVLNARYKLPNGAYSISFEAYTKWLKNQTEYNGTIYSFIATDYNLSSVLLHGKGHNYGFNLMLTKDKGWLTGWIAYAYSRAMRTYSTGFLSGTFPSSHERPHELNSVLTFHIGKKWDIGFTCVFASGTPFTAPKMFYVLNRYIVSEYAEHNANRLRPYFRLDGSVNYHFNSTRHIHEHGLNLSVYNMTAQENDLFYYMDFSGWSYEYKRTSFFMKVLPSISYYMKF